MASKVIDIDRGYKKFVRKMKLASARGPFVTVGVHSKDDSGRTSEAGQPAGNAEVLAFHEFGTTNMPARPTLRPAIDANRNKYARLEAAGLGRWVDGTWTMAQVMGVVGLAAKADVQKKITSLKDPELAESTKKSKVVGGKSGNNPLIDTGQMRAAIDFVVDTRGVK